MHPSLSDPDTLREFVRTVQEGIYITNSRGEILDANPAFLAMFGVSSLEELRKYSAADLLVDPRRREQELALLERDGAIREFELQIARPDGGVSTVLDTTYAYRDPATGEVVYHGILFDITARKELEDRLREQSLRDPLTGCWNRRYLDELSTRMEALQVKQWGCLFIDIDHFKRYNDEHGHKAGDTVLVKMARFLLRQVRAEESVIRIGGDEFVVILAGADAPRTESVANRLQLTALRTAPVAFSLGWAARERGESLERTLSRADQRLLAVRVVERSPLRREEDSSPRGL
jgi:diguanylate cyclase (GGDEF)-like protein/PAS domain S-box-containing protein